MKNVEWYHGEETRGMDPLPTEERTLHITGRFGKMFPNLDPLWNSDSQLEELGTMMGGGRLDDDNENIPAGFTSLGQFIDHDIIYDPTSLSEQQSDLTALENFRTPAFELDSLYGSGPAVSSHLYDRQQVGKLLLDEERDYDLPRNSQGTALIGDPRNDQNLILAQLHLAFIKFHNTVFDIALGINDGIDNETRLEKTQRLVRWHYQWIIFNEYLPKIVADNVIRDVLRERKFYQWEKFSDYPFIPVEFSVAAYRFGHSQARSIYRINDHLGNLPLFMDSSSSGERKDLRGGHIKKIHTVNWKNFFETGVPPTSGANRASKKIDTNLAGSLQSLPPEFFPDGPPSLAVRTLQRGRARKLPSGQAVAGAIAKVKGFTLLEEEKLWSGLPPEFNGRPVPLWYYILKEAEVQKAGTKLGSVGGYIVAEVFIGLLDADQKSFRHAKIDGGWKPVLPIIRDGNVTKGDFTIVDLLKFAEVETQ